MKNSKQFYGIRKKLVVFTILAAILPLGIMGGGPGRLHKQKRDRIESGELFPQQQQDDWQLPDDGAGI